MKLIFEVTPDAPGLAAIAAQYPELYDDATPAQILAIEATALWQREGLVIGTVELLEDEAPA